MKNKLIKSGATSLWGGRFDKDTSELMRKINSSIGFDRRLYKQDILGSKCHVRMLAKCHIITNSESLKLISALDKVESEIESGKFAFSEEYEDIHLNIEKRVIQIIGAIGGKLNTARSRNDQVATDLRLWVRDSIDELDASITLLQSSLFDHIENHFDTVMPGFTHLQPAQPVTLGHHLLAYIQMFGRDRERISDTRKRLNECPLGAAALAGTSFNIDRNMTSREMGFDRPMENSIDAVSDRDFVVESLSNIALISMHLSRIAEEMVLWANPAFGFITISDSFSTGSSIMPQKKNPDAAELVRGKTGRIIGALVSLLTMLKGLPLSYSKDMQEDKEPIFDAFENILLCLSAIRGMLDNITFMSGKMSEMAKAGYTTATELADWLVKEKKIPFREAHGIVGKIVLLAEKNMCYLEELKLEQLKNIEPKITKEIYSVLNVNSSVKSKTSYGSTNPKEVKKLLKRAKKRWL